MLYMLQKNFSGGSKLKIIYAALMAFAGTLSLASAISAYLKPHDSLGSVIIVVFLFLAFGFYSLAYWLWTIK